MLLAVGARCALILGLLVAFGCGNETSDAAPRQSPPAPRAKNERPLPAFEGRTLDGSTLSSSSLLGRRLLLFFFSIDAPEAPAVAQAVAAVSRLRGKHNFDVVGVGVADTSRELEALAQAYDLDFPIIDDTRGSIVSRLGLRVPVALVGVDAEGYVSFGLASFPQNAADVAGFVESDLRQQLRLPALGESLEPVLGEKPLAPEFSAETLNGGTFDLAKARGRPVILVFFLHTCPHCHAELGQLKQELANIPEEKRPRLVGVSVANNPSAVRDELERAELDFFEVVFDPDSKIRNAYGATAGTPDSFLIDAEGRVTARVRGWREDRDPPLMRMRLARLAGVPIPMLLHQSGYSGNEFCGVCHESQYETYQLTSHSFAFDTLVKHGADRNAECVSCHVVGFDQPGGYALGARAAHLEDVGCESCHGRGGPHLSPDFLQDAGYETACATCHDAKHSLGFSYATFLPKVSHAANQELLALPLESKRRVLAERSELRSDLLKSDARYVGSDACQSCHAAEFETWSGQPHAGAVKSLEAQGKANQGTCLSCHTTGYGRPGGFPTGGDPGGHADLARVGCESCHGPGEQHVAEGAKKVGSIVSLGDKCDSCVILQICGSCHDDANDPGFEFEVLDKIEAQRHGTIEPGTGKPKDSQAALPPSAILGHLERAFADTPGAPGEAASTSTTAPDERG
jgi:peroxiredoxin